MVAFGPETLCYWNCVEYVEKFGGEVVHGWQGMCWPEVFIMLHHHAVVRTETGDLLDVTVPSGPNPGYTLFLEDNSIVPERDYPPTVPNRFCALPSREAEMREMMRAETAQFDARRVFFARLKERGIPWKNGALAVLDDPKLQKIALALSLTQLGIERATAICEAATNMARAKASGGAS